MGWKTFNDRFAILAFVMLVAILFMSIFYKVPDIVLGTIGPLVVLIVQFYFRKSPGGE